MVIVAARTQGPRRVSQRTRWPVCPGCRSPTGRSAKGEPDPPPPARSRAAGRQPVIPARIRFQVFSAPPSRRGFRGGRPQGNKGANLAVRIEQIHAREGRLPSRWGWKEAPEDLLHRNPLLPLTGLVKLGSARGLDHGFAQLLEASMDGCRPHSGRRTRCSDGRPSGVCGPAPGRRTGPRLLRSAGRPSGPRSQRPAPGFADTSARTAPPGRLSGREPARRADTVPGREPPPTRTRIDGRGPCADSGDKSRPDRGGRADSGCAAGVAPVRESPAAFLLRPGRETAARRSAVHEG